MRLRSKFAVKCAKATSSLIKKLNRGSGVTLPGYVARLIDPNILKELSGQVRKKTIVTMGTNGKTTTNAILCKALEHEGQKVIINRTGANMLNGIISAFVLATDKHGNLDADYACIEVDEIASVGVLPKIEPDCALLTNISRDQLDRFGEVDITYNKLMTAVTSVPKTTLIINCDDILSYSLAQESKNAFVTYGISEQIFDDVSRSEIRESIFCRKCGKKLEYQFFHYGQLGLYHCPNCGSKWIPSISNEYNSSSLTTCSAVYSGFENHGGRTYIGDHTPFGKVFYGLGNTGKSGYEGVIYKNVIATYLHGPLLPKNPQVCDYFLEKALQRKYGEEVKLEPLKDETEKKANSYIADRYSYKIYVLRDTVKRHT